MAKIAVKVATRAWPWGGPPCAGVPEIRPIGPSCLLDCGRIDSRMLSTWQGSLSSPDGKTRPGTAFNLAQLRWLTAAVTPAATDAKLTDGVGWAASLPDPPELPQATSARPLSATIPIPRNCLRKPPPLSAPPRGSLDRSPPTLNGLGGRRHTHRAVRVSLKRLGRLLGVRAARTAHTPR